MYKRLLLSGLALTTLASYGTESAAPAKDKPNIIMFLVDDMGCKIPQFLSTTIRPAI